MGQGSHELLPEALGFGEVRTVRLTFVRSEGRESVSVCVCVCVRVRVCCLGCGNSVVLLNLPASTNRAMVPGTRPSVARKPAALLLLGDRRCGC